MKKLQDNLARLKDHGTDAQRSLLRATPAEMPPDLKEKVRARIESRMHPAAATPIFARWAVASCLMFVAGGAMAFGVAKGKDFWRAPKPAADVLQPRQSPNYSVRTTRKAIVLPPSDQIDSQAEGSPKHARRKTHVDTPPQHLAMVEPPVAIPAPAAPKVSAPAFGLHDFRDVVENRSATVPAEGPVQASPPALPRPGRLLVSWPSRRGASLDVVDLYGQGDALARVVGTVNRTPLSIEIRKGLMVGKIGDEVVNMWLMGKEQAGGSIAGHEVHFTVSPTQNGYLLRGNLPGHTARLEMHKGILRWYPGCENALAATSPGVYQGTCSEGKNASVVLPPAFRKLPPLPRLVLLAIVLTERDPVFLNGDTPIINPTP